MGDPSGVMSPWCGCRAGQGGLALQQYWRRALPGMGMPEVCHTPAGNLQAIPLLRQGAAEGNVKQRNRTSD